MKTGSPLLNICKNLSYKIFRNLMQNYNQKYDYHFFNKKFRIRQNEILFRFKYKLKFKFFSGIFHTFSFIVFPSKQIKIIKRAKKQNSAVDNVFLQKRIHCNKTTVKI